MKKIFIIGVLIFFSRVLFAQSQADLLLNFILKNKTRTSLTLQKNDLVLANLNDNRLMPLAGIEKIIVATEFAKQAAYNVFSFNAAVPLADINKYYIKGIDGGNHANWIKFETRVGHIKRDSVKLIDVARGMIQYNSNANTEYLMDMLGFNNIQNNLRMFKLKQHTIIYPDVSSLFIYQNPKKISENELLEEIKLMNDSNYQKAIFAIHSELKFENTYQQNYHPQDFTPKMQQLWIERLTAATTYEYARVCRIINSRLILNDKSFAVLGKLLETAMEAASNKAWLKHYGAMSGSAPGILTKALYATLKDDTKIELIYFFNDLTSGETASIKLWMNDFEAKVLKDENFRKKLSAGIADQKK